MKPYPQLDQLRPFERLFLAWSLALEKPWPRHPYLKAVARRAFSLAMAEAKTAEAMARAAILEALRDELRECSREIGKWTLLAEAHAIEASQHADDWAALVRAPHVRTEETADE